MVSRSLLVVAVLAAGATGAAAQVTAPGRAGARAAAHAADDTLTTSFSVLGLPVILRRVTANNVVAANLYLLGGTQQLSPENAGIETMLLETSESGTMRYSKGALRRSMARLGSTIVSEPGADWTMFGLRSTTAGFDSSWAIFADRLTAPRLDSVELDLVREKFLAAVRQRDDSPDALVNELADSLLYEGHPYGLPVIGTERTLGSLRAGDLRRYLRNQMVTSRMLLVVVGNIQRTRLERLVRTTIARLPRGTYQWKAPGPPHPADSAPGAGVRYVQRSLPTNYVLGYYAGPPAGSEDYQALRIATAVLSGRLFAEIRSRRNLSYAVHAPFVERAVSAGGFYVTTVSPDEVLRIMKEEVRALKARKVDPGALERLVQQFITEYFLDNETNSDQANFLARSWLYRGDYHAADRFVDELRRVTPDDVQRVAVRYMHDVRFAYVGDSLKAPRAAFAGF
jgi:zinc protease